jgi:hypothetical protein
VIEQTSFLGMPLKTQRQRRLLVVLYYAVLIGFAIDGLWMSKKTWGPLAAQTLVFGGLLGGIRIGGPVKVYSQPHFPLDMDSTVHTLNLAGRRPFDTSTPETWVPLDERERTQRDTAHYTAYRILRWVFGVFVLTYFLGTVWAPAWLADKTLFLLWLFLLYVLSLPQAVVLWTEPQEPAEELAEVRTGAR